MTELFTYDELIHFLLHAKRQTQAMQRNEASITPLLPGSEQREYREAPFFYRDIWFGTASFVGQETTYFRQHPIWSMNYSGGITSEITNKEEMHQIYACLRQALQQVVYERPFRGPQTYYTGSYRYLDATQGDLAQFRGEEIIMRGNKRVYELHYSGCLLK